MYLFIFPDVLITRGVSRTLLIDLKESSRFLFFPSPSKTFFQRFRIETLEEIQNSCSPDELSFLNDFVDFIITNNKGLLVKDIACFPEIEEVYYSPFDIEVVVVDVDSFAHRYADIALQLKTLSVQHLQIRIFTPVSIAEIQEILSFFINLSWHSIEILVCKPVWSSPQEITTFLHPYPMVSVIVFNQKQTTLYPVESKYKAQSISFVLYSNQKFLSPADCGIISSKTLYNQVTLQSFMLNKRYNNCLYKKLFITKDGNIANCPCLPYTYGNINQDDINLCGIIKSQDFQQHWHLKKDFLNECCDCEFRYICNDCRAFVDNIQHDKPLKCTYSPCKMKWEDD